MPDDLKSVLRALDTARPNGRRTVIAIGGPPAAGKSTFSQTLRGQLGDRATLLQMDAFHFDDTILIARGHRDRKGAPHTFDVMAYRHYLATLRSGPALEMSVPVFDRSLELSRNCAELVTSDHEIIITEGNYLLLQDEPWAGLHGLFDLTVSVEAPLDLIEKRILERWRRHGLSEAEARARAESNDLPNARLVTKRSRPAQITVRSDGGN